MALRFFSNIKIPPPVIRNRAWYYRKSQPEDSLVSASDSKDLAKFYGQLSNIYYKMNDLVTVGMHRNWRSTFLSSFEVTDQSKVLDLAGGNGINTFRLLTKCAHFSSDSNFSVTLYDLNPDMINVAQKHMKQLNYNSKLVEFVEGDIHKLPFDNDSFDVIIMFFGIRREIDFNVVFPEVHRVLKPKGKFLVLDFCFSKNPTLIQRLYCNYLQYVSSTIEKLFIGDLEVSLFLQKDVRSILSKDEIRSLLEEAKFQKIEFKPLSLGIAGMTISHKA